MNVQMPDGTIITGVPEGITQTELLARYQRFAEKPVTEPQAAQPPAPRPTPPEAARPMPVVDPMGNIIGSPDIVPQPAEPEMGLPAVAGPKKPPSEFAPLQEGVKGLASGVIGLKSMWENAGVMKDVGALTTAQQRMDLFGKIDSGQINDYDQLRGESISTSQARSYLAADPETREKMKQRLTNEIGNRRDFVKASLETLNRYQQDAQQYRGRTVDLTDVEGVADFTNWLTYNMGSGAVQMVPIMLAAATTGVAGVAALGAGMGTAEAIGNRLQFLEPKLKGMNPDDRANTVVDYIVKTGDTSLVVGLVSGAFDSILGPAANLAKKGIKNAVGDKTWKEAIRVGAREMPRQVGEEFITGGLQEFTQQAGAFKEGEIKELMTRETAKKVFNAAAAEAAGAIGPQAGITGARAISAAMAKPEGVGTQERVEPTGLLGQAPQAGLPGLVQPGVDKVPEVPVIGVESLDQQIKDMLAASSPPPAADTSQDVNAMLQELLTAKGETPPAVTPTTAVAPAAPVTPPTPQEIPSGTQAPQAVEAEAQGQEAAAPGELSLEQRYDAVIQSYRNAGMDQNADQVELGRKYNLTPQGVANSEEIADRLIRQNRLIKGVEAGTNQPIEPRHRTVADLYETKYESASSDFVPKDVQQLVLNKANDYINQLAEKGVHYEEVDSRFPRELVNIKNAESALRGQFLRYANQLKAVEKDYKRANMAQFEQAEAELGQMLGVDLKAMREAKAAPKTEGQIAVGSRVEFINNFGEKEFGTVSKLMPASEQDKLPAMAMVQSDEMSNAQTPIQLDRLRPTTQPKVTKEAGPTAKERREKQQDNRRSVGYRLDDAIDKAKKAGDTKTVDRLTNLRAKFDRKEAGPRLVEKEIKKAKQAMAGKAAAPTVKPSGPPVSAEEKAKIEQEMLDALADLGDIFGKGTRLNIVPEQEQKLIPVLTRLMDSAFRLGYIKFKEAAKYVLGYIRSKMGKDVADQVTIDHLQGAYIGMAGKYQDQGASSKKEVVSVETLDELEEVIEEPAEEEIFSLSNPENQFEVAQEIADHFIDGNSFAGINEARTFISDNFGIEIRPGTPTAKQADEAIEAGVVIAAREIIADGRKNGQSSLEIYDRLVELYNSQPNLAVRSSTSVANQAYSTPVPLAFVASELAGITPDTTVYEPTAGNGMLVIGGKGSNLTLNELNADRYQMLTRLYPDARVTQGNALQVTNRGRDFDVIIENPPFGKVDDISNIDHDIALHSLKSLTDTGKAVLILGGVQSNTEDGRREGYRGKAKREFYYELYNSYNVVDHFTVGGNMYAKQGTTYPVDVIVIDGNLAIGNKSQRDLPAADLPQLITSYEQLKEKLNEGSLVSGKPKRPSGADVGVGTDGEAGAKGVAAGAGRPGGGDGTAGGRPAGGVEAGVSEAGTAVSEQPATTGRGTGATQPGAENVPESERGRGSVAGTGETAAGGRKVLPEGRGLGYLGGVSIVAGERVGSGLANRAGQETETAGQVTYIPRSQANSVGTLVPRAMADSIEQSLARVEAAEGNLDDYVATSLEMDPETVRELFSAEQVDALALAIRNAEEGKGFIIGDQTGVGKGRVVAAMIRYALVNDKIPIFVTEKPNLYSDMIRDLDDIGMTNELGLDTAKPKILITNNDEKIPYTLLRKVNGELVENNLTLRSPASKAAMEGTLKKMQQDDGLGDFKVIFTTYAQLQTYRGAETERMRFVRHFGAGNYMIFDESHNAGGAGEQQARTKEQREKAKNGESLVTGRASYIRNLVRNAFGTFFSSATYAKRPDVMDLYSSTDMKLAVDNISELADAIKNGGIPMQQTVAQMLAQVGQYIRRERTFAGVSYDTQETKVDKATAENMATSMRDILAFSRAKEEVVKSIQKEFDKQGAKLGMSGEKTAVQSANFGSIMHNLIDQMLLSLKTQDSVRYAIERLKAGEKVVMTVSNTMGSFLSDYADEMNLSAGDKVDLSFADLYERYLEKQRMIRISRPSKDPSKSSKKQTEDYRLTDEDLGPALVAEFNRIKDFINEAGFGAAPISPIDFMHAELRKAGYKTEEITGRNLIVSYEAGSPVLSRRSSNIRQRVNAVKAFNAGQMDVIILNQAGSTGLSLHASSKNKVEGQNKRHMIIVQPEKNIDTHMQMLGRVHRTGQVVPPAYSQMMADIPAEMRPAAVLLKKMASLNANTTASRKSAVTAEGAVDFMNEYGGQVVMEYLRDNPEVHQAIGGKDVVKLSEDPTEADEEDIRKFTGYIPILPIKQQEEIYKDLIDRYNDLIQREDSMGTNKLEAKAADLDARTISSKQITEDKGDPSVFAQPAFMEQVDVKRTVKPYSKEEVQQQVKDNLKGMTTDEFRNLTVRDAKQRVTDFGTPAIADMQAAEKPDPVKIQQFKDQLNTQYNNVKTIIDTYPIGSTVSIKNTNGVFVYGVVTNIESKGKTKNPVAGSDWKMTLALANGDAKSITLNFSQIGTTYTLTNEETVQYLNPETLQNERIPLIDMFDRGATVRREKRWMVTGNILAGYAAVGNMGQIISYTKDDGTTAQGILMSRTFDFEKQQKNAPVKLSSVEKVNAFFSQFGIGSEVSTENGVLKIKNMGYEKYRFTVPSSKRDGGSYYLDSDLTRITGDFYKSGPTMNTTVYGSDLNKALQYIMSQREESFVAVSNKDQAREAFQVPLKNVQPDAEMLSQNADEALISDREANIAKYREMRQRRASIMRRFEEGKAGLSEQSEMQRLKTSIREMKREIDATKPERRSAKNFFTDATKAWDRGDISDDVYAVIETLYKKFPFVLEGLRFSVTQTKDSSVSGEFFALARLVRLYKGTNGVSDPSTARHEIVHSLEQMMSAEATFDVVQDWTEKLEKAINTDKSPKAQAFFKAVLAFMEDPSEQTYEAAMAALPSYEYYQYLNPSEYWAVNAEKLMARKLGTGWDRFVLSVKKLYEGLKYLIGFDNQYVIHRTFDDIMNARAGRVTKNVLVDYVSRVSITLANVNTRRNYKGGPAPLSSWTAPNESNLDNFFYRIQDKHIDTKRVQEAITNEIGDIEDRFDAYMKEELYHGRVAKQTIDFLKNDLQPLLKDMVNRGVKLEDFEEYLQNRTAPDRNALIASRNPMMPDGGSGIFNDEAQDYMNSLDPEAKQNFEELAEKVDQIVRETQDILVDNGLEKAETIAGWRETQPLYVPLNRDPDELDFTTSSTGLGQGLSTRGRFTKTATGSLKTVVDILGNIALQREKAIVKSEKARAGRALYGLAISSPNPDFWMPVNPAAIKNKKKLVQELVNLGLRPDEAENIILEPRVPRFDKVTGQISYEVNPSMRGSENVFSVRINGEDRFVFFNPGDPRAQRMVKALKNLDADQLSGIMGKVAEMTRFYAALNTQYNPVFGAWNFMRDNTAGAINLNGTPIANRKLEVFRNSFTAVRAIYRDLRDKGATTPEMRQWIDLFEQFQKAGGQTGYRDTFTRSKEKATVVQRELANLNAGTARKAANSIFQWLSDYNDAMENAVRLAAFKAALEEGLSEERAASLAKNLTVNFNRRGQSSTWLNGLFAFLNASIQGTSRMMKLLVDRTPDGRYKLSKHGKRIIAGGMAIGVFQALALSMAGFGEDEPPEFLKNKNLIIPVTGGNYLIIPMPLGLNVLPNIGRTLTEYAMSNRPDPKNLANNLFGIVIDAFNPLGSSGFTQTIAPTLLDPIVAIAENKDAFGRPISKPDRATNPTPGYERNRESSSAFSQGMSYALNYMTGGGEYGIGLVSPTADEIDYLIAQYTGGVGRELTKAARFVGSLGKDEEIPPYKVPILGKLYGETTTPSAVTDKFYKNVITLAEHEGTIKRMREKKASTQEYKQEYPETKLINRVNRLENDISKLNRTIKDLSDKPESDFNKDRIKRLKEQKTRMMTQFNQAMAAAQE
jgi:hypothetical protein